MKIKHLILLTTAAVAASSLSSCKEEPYIISAEEEFTRNFIKEFGLIDPNQDWNLAEGSTVTVKVGSTPAEVKAYMKVDNTYYIVADLKDVAGDVKIPFDMPEGTTDIMVKINGKRYYTSPGGTVDPNAPTSRGLINEGTNTFADVKVTVEENPHGRVLTLYETTMKEALGKLPENPDPISAWSESNLGNVTDNFFAKAKEFYIFPEFWNTSGHASNEIGIYYYVDPETEGAEHIVLYPAGKYEWDFPKPTPEVDKWIMKVPFFKNPSDFVTPYKYDYEGNLVTTNFAGNSSVVTDAVKYESKGVYVKFDKEISFGFYIKQSTNVMYSEKILNQYAKKINKDGEEEWKRPSYVATYKEGEDTEGNDKRHLCFEDWNGDNWDLNDMVFRVYGFDNIADNSMEKGTVTDIDNPNIDDNNEGGGDEGDPTTPTTPEVDEPYQWLLAVEDLGATDDFDFNDIIIGISSETVNTLPEGARTDGTATQYREVTFTALAAGGTLPSYVYYGDTQLYPDGHADRAEWHKWFGAGNLSSVTMINTNYGVDNQKGASCTLYFGISGEGKSNFSLEKLGEGAIIGAKDSGLKIGIDKSGQMSYSSDFIDTDYFTKGDDGYFIKPSDPGSAPQMFLIPDAGHTGGWKWPKERTHIQNSYKNFGEWVNDAGTAPEWYKDKDATGVCRPVPSK